VTGALVLVGTPLGNLGDLSPRAVEALRTADVVACEDTRRTGRLLHAAGAAGARLVVLNEHTEYERCPELLDLVAAGERVALVSDAGMPAISDPGQRLVRAARDAGLPLDVVPGPTAVVTGLVLSGLATDRFVFEGFLPRKGSERAARIGELVGERRTVVLYEAPHRLVRTLTDLVAALGPEREVAVARELTKLHQEVWSGTLGEALERAGACEPRGEHVVVLSGAPAPAAPSWDDDALRDLLRLAVERGSSRRDATDEVAASTGVSRRRIYRLASDLE
jgi:16S rRNA (cytidine1402-2'-O)-methyltransferase